VFDGTDDELAELRAAAARVAARLVSPAAVDDVAQEAAIRLIANWERVRAYARPWIVRTATNLAIAHLRRDGRPHPIDVVATETDDAALRLDIADAMAALPVRQRQAITLRYLADLDEGSVAELLGCSRGSVKRHLHRAVAALRHSPHLHAETDRKETRMPNTDWRDRFVPAVEPARGWPPRPWDHRFVNEDGSWDRVAIDANGEIIVDADGDEVMSGPGFDFEVVKVLPSYEDAGPPDPRPPVDDAALDVVLDDASEIAQWFGHPWVGDEHAALALARKGALPGVDAARLSRGIAAFYEGPYADARLREVARREFGGQFARPDANSLFWSHALVSKLRAARTVAALADALLGAQRSLMRRLLDEM
jgi:RNA polymerase sigma factor (sigma-70 family)